MTKEIRMSKATGDWGFVRISGFGLLSDFVIRISSFSSASSPRLLPNYERFCLILALSPNSIPRAGEIGLDAGVLAFTGVLSVLTGVLFGLAPAWQASRPDVHEKLKETTRGVTGGRARLRQVLVISEVALTLVMLVGAGLLLRSFHHLQLVNAGFSPERVLSFRLDRLLSLDWGDKESSRRSAQPSD